MENGGDGERKRENEGEEPMLWKEVESRARVSKEANEERYPCSEKKQTKERE